MTLIRERDDLQKEVDDLKRKLTNRESIPSNPEVTRKNDWATGDEDAPLKGASRVTRSRASVARRRLISSSESEFGSTGAPSAGIGAAPEGM